MKNVKNWAVGAAVAAALAIGNSFCGWFSIISDAEAQYAVGTNYTEQGALRTVIQGSLDVTSVGEIDIETGGDFLVAGSSVIVELAILDGVTASTADLNATTNFEETISATTSEVTMATAKTLDITDVGGLQIANASVGATAAELDAYTITVYMPIVCTAGSVFVVGPHAGAITGIWSVINGVLGTGDVPIDPQIAAADITDGDLTLTASGSAAGDVDTSAPTAANVITAGQAIEIATDGNCDGTATATFSILIDR